MFENSSNIKSYRLMFTVLILLVILAFLVALIPSWREKAQGLIWSDKRIVLAKSQAQLYSAGPMITAIKVKTENSLFLEVYITEASSQNLRLMNQFPLDGNQDGFFNFQSQATNLVITDVDKDGYMDIMVPSFDERQQARMNIFRYNHEVETFEKYTQN